MMRLKLFCSFFLAMLLLPAALAQTYTADGVGYARDSSKAYPLSEGHVVMMNMTDYYKFEGVDPDNPMNDLVGSCFGEIEIEGATTAGDGYCNWSDGQGNTVLIRWEATGVNEEGHNIGAWSIVGGTGKWQGSSGAGNYRYAAEEGGGRNQVTGEITLIN